MTPEQKKRRTRIFSAAVGLVLAAIAFAWYQVRPMVIRANCADVARTGISTLTPDWPEITDARYLDCVRSQGLPD